MGRAKRDKVWVWAVWSLTTGCVVELERALACGDGYVDRKAGEECDPNDAARAHEGACATIGMAQGRAGCDPETCRILVDPIQCSVCGDGVATGLEACDGLDLRGQVCPAGDARLRCDDRCQLDTSLCETCGDFAFTPGVEECDASARCSADDECPSGLCAQSTGLCQTDGTVTGTWPCSILTPPATAGGPYTAGTFSFEQCTASCTIDRTTCGFCGNGALDDAYFDIGPSGDFVARPAEICDGPLARLGALGAFCRDWCTDGAGTSAILKCPAVCGPKCDGFVVDDPAATPDTSCCVADGEPCRVDFPCCFALEHPELAEQACETAIGPGGVVTLVCRVG